LQNLCHISDRAVFLLRLIVIFRKMASLTKMPSPPILPQVETPWLRLKHFTRNKRNQTTFLMSSIEQAMAMQSRWT